MKATFNMWGRRLARLKVIGPVLHALWRQLVKIAKGIYNWFDDLGPEAVAGFFSIIITCAFVYMIYLFIVYIGEENQKIHLPASMEVMKPHLDTNRCYKEKVDEYYANTKKVTVANHEYALDSCKVDTTALMNEQKNYFEGK